MSRAPRDPEGDEEPDCTGMGAGFSGSTPPGAELRPASSELSLSHIWKKGSAEDSTAASREHISPLVGNR